MRILPHLMQFMFLILFLFILFYPNLMLVISVTYIIDFSTNSGYISLFPEWEVTCLHMFSGGYLNYTHKM